MPPSLQGELHGGGCDGRASVFRMTLALGGGRSVRLQSYPRKDRQQRQQGPMSTATRRAFLPPTSITAFYLNGLFSFGYKQLR